MSTRRAKRTRGALARALLAAGLVGAVCLACGSGEVRVSVTEGTTLLVHDVRGRGDDAEIHGYLRYLDEAGCFVLESDPGDGRTVRHVAVWPPGSTVQRTGGQVSGVRVPRVGAIQIGEWVTAGGGYANPATTERDLPEVAPECLAGGGEFAFLHEVSPPGS